MLEIPISLYRRAAGDWRGYDHKREAIALIGLLCVMVFAVFFWRIQGTVHGRILSNAVIGADTGENLKGFETGDLSVFDYHKHPLTIAIDVVELKALRLIGLGADLATALLLAFTAAKGALFFHLFLVRRGTSPRIAFLTTLLALSLFSAATLLSLVETYSTTFALIMLTSLLLGELALETVQRPPACSIIAGVICAILGWANLPAISYILVYSALGWHALPKLRDRAAYLFATPIAIAAAGAMLPNGFIAAHEGLHWFVTYNQKWASFHHFFDGELLANYFLNFFVYSVVAPAKTLVCKYTVAQLTLLLHSPARLLLWGMVSSLALAGCVSGLKDRAKQPILLGLLGIISGYFVFHIYFDPADTMLYAIQWTPLFVALAAIGLRPSSMLYGAIAFSILLCVFLNFPPLNPGNLSALPYCP